MWCPVQKPITTLELIQTNIIGVQGVKVLQDCYRTLPSAIQNLKYVISLIESQRRFK